MGLRDSYTAFGEAVRSLYGHDTLELAKDDRPFGFDDSLMEEISRLIYEERGFTLSQLTTPEGRTLIKETQRVLGSAIESVLPHEVPDTIRYALENNAFVFSGFKTFHAMREVGLSMLTDKGDIKPFNDFLTDVRRINAEYNHNYLYAEYNHALGAAQMAAKWHDFECDGDKYDLQYRTAGDDKVREEHAALNGTTLPPSDPFWEQFLPPNGWNCRCTAVQVRKNKYPTSYPELAMRRGKECTDGAKRAIFRYNAGKSLQLFPPKHPYYKAPEEAKKVIKELAEEQRREKRIAEIVKELPGTLTADQKKTIAEHCLTLEKEFGITKGKAMTYDEANKGKENPEYNKGDGYYINCQTCTVTHWLRRLGFNVQAQPNVKKNRNHQGSTYDKLDKAGVKWTQRFINLDDSDVDYDWSHRWGMRKGYKTMTPKRLQEYFKEKFDHDGVYEIYCAWKRGDAHVFCAEVVGGNVRMFDPQSGKDNVSSYVAKMKPAAVGVIRIDDKKVNPKIGDLFLEVK